MTDGPRIVIQHPIPAPAANVWEAIKDQAWLVSDVEDIRAMEVLSTVRSPSGEVIERLVSWQVWLKGSEIRWQEKQVLDSQSKRVDFQQQEGMFSLYKGHYQVTPRGDGSIIDFHLEVGTGMSYLAELIDPVMAEAFKAIADESLHRLDDVAASS